MDHDLYINKCFHLLVMSKWNCSVVDLQTQSQKHYWNISRIDIENWRKIKGWNTSKYILINHSKRSLGNQLRIQRDEFVIHWRL